MTQSIEEVELVNWLERAIQRAADVVKRLRGGWLRSRAKCDPCSRRRGKGLDRATRRREVFSQRLTYRARQTGHCGSGFGHRGCVQVDRLRGFASSIYTGRRTDHQFRPRAAFRLRPGLHGSRVNAVCCSCRPFPPPSRRRSLISVVLPAACAAPLLSRLRPAAFRSAPSGAGSRQLGATARQRTANTSQLLSLAWKEWRDADARRRRASSPAHEQRRNG